ncbi:MAG: HEAT repeat domain-containing protein [Acidimicrobiales bacterium]
MASHHERADHVARRRAAAVAGHKGDTLAARQYLADVDAHVRATALGALHRTGALDPDDLIGALADQDGAVRRRALELVASLRGVGPATSISIVALLGDADPTVVEVAAWACGECETAEPGAVERLAALADRTAGSTDAQVREAAVAALGAIGDRAGLSAILGATADKATVRRRAVLALAPFDGPEVDEALQRATADRDWQVRQAAEDLLG